MVSVSLWCACLLLFTACGGDDLDDAKPKEEIPADNTKNEETDEPSEPSFVIEPVTGYHHNLLNYWESDGGGGSISFHLFSFRMFSWWKVHIFLSFPSFPEKLSIGVQKDITIMSTFTVSYQ